MARLGCAPSARRQYLSPEPHHTDSGQRSNYEDLGTATEAQLVEQTRRHQREIEEGLIGEEAARRSEGHATYPWASSTAQFVKENPIPPFFILTADIANIGRRCRGENSGCLSYPHRPNKTIAIESSSSCPPGMKLRARVSVRQPVALCPLKELKNLRLLWVGYWVPAFGAVVS